MKDIPLYSARVGAASLILREVPYKGMAYIKVLSVLPGCMRDLAQECLDFCRAAGAEQVFISGGEEGDFPLYTEIYTMTCPAEAIPAGQAALFPVLPETVGKFREFYNRAMRPVSNAATMERRDEAELLETGGGYFVHQGGKLLGLGQIVDGELRAVVSMERGCGEAVVQALVSACSADLVHLQVASTNERAIGLYTRMGFLKTAVKSRWYQIYPPAESL